jgi:hypothetical protein
VCSPAPRLLPGRTCDPASATGWDGMSEVAERIQEEVTEIAEGLARREGKPVREAWTEALTLHRVRKGSHRTALVRSIYSYG